GHPGLDQGTGAHGAGLEGDDQGAAVEAPGAESGGGGAEGLQLGVGGGGALQLAAGPRAGRRGGGWRPRPRPGRPASSARRWWRPSSAHDDGSAGHGAIRRWWTIQLSRLTSPSGPAGPGKLDRMVQLAFRPRRHPSAPGRLRPARGGTKGGIKGGPDLTEAMGSGTVRDA